MAVAGPIPCFAVNGGTFRSGSVDRIARGVLALVAVIDVPCVGVQIYGDMGRIDRAAATKAT